MKIKLYSVFDSKLAAFDVPRSGMNDASVIRTFADAVNDERNVMWFKHPEDYSLFFVGTFDDELGQLIACAPKSLVTASALKEVIEKPVLFGHGQVCSSDNLPVGVGSVDYDKKLPD